MSEINWSDRCWVTTIFLVREDKKVLLTLNGRLNMWIPAGGHISPGDNPDEAIAREVREELPGFSFEFFPAPSYENKGNVKITRPIRVQIEKVLHHGIHINILW